MHLYLGGSRSSTLAPRRSTGLDRARLDLTRLELDAQCWNPRAPLLPAARPRSRLPARCLPHSRRRLLPIDPEIHSPVASSSPSTSRISARPPRPACSEEPRSASESQFQAPARLPIRLVVQLASALSCPVLSCPVLSTPSSRRLSVSVSVRPPDLSRRQASVRCPSPTRD